MKKTIRRNVFETNSSSSHVLSMICGKEYKGRFSIDNTYFPDTLVIEEREFEMQGYTICTLEEKIEYIYALNKTHYRYETDEEFIEFLHEFIPEDIDIVIKHNPDIYCHVDHQSRDILDDCYVSWREFILGPYLLTLLGD